MNKVTIIGRLTGAPEEKTTPSGTTVVRFTVAVNRRFNREQTDFIPIVAWRDLGERCAKYLVKGQKAAVSGELHIESFTDRYAERRTRTEVVADDVEFLDKPVNEQVPERVTDKVNDRVNEPKAEQEMKGIFGQASFLDDDEKLPF